MQRKNNLKRLKYKLWVRCLLSLLILFCFLFSLFLFRTGLHLRNNNVGEHIYTYNINQNLSYQVHLYENSFIDEATIGENIMYISDLVKNITVFFDYAFTGNKETQLEYVYSIRGNLVGEYASTDAASNIWTKDYVFVEEKSKTNIDALRVDINEEINLDFLQFNDEVKNFKNKFGIFINSRLDIIMDIVVNGVIDSEEIQDKQQMILSIPLGIQAFSIQKDYNEFFSQNINKEIDNEYVDKYILLAITILLISIILFVASFKIIFNVVKKTYYDKKLYQILKKYGEVIAEVDSPIKDRDYDIVMVKNIEEMIDLEQELRIPITFYELKKSQLGEFSLIYNNILYKYTLTDDKK